MAAPGRLITVEGLEGAGKSTALAVVESWLQERGRDVLVTREPGGTELGEALRRLLLAHRQPAMSADTETLLMFAARAEHLAQVLRPALERGCWVVSDRFTDATYAYQGAGRGVGAGRVAVLEDWVQGSLRPHFTLLLDVPEALGLERAAGRGADPDRFESEQAEFFRRARACYRARAAAEPGRIRVIDATAPREAVAAAIRAALEQGLAEP